MKAVLSVIVLSLVLLASLPFIRNAETELLSDSVRSEAPGKFVRLSRGMVHYELTGPADRPVVVFVHGFSVPSYTWERNVVPLAEQGYRVLRFDMYGRGFSDRPGAVYDRSLFVSQIAELADALELGDELNLVGISMGGAIVGAFAADHPGRVRSVTLLAPFNAPIDIGPLSIPILGDYLAYSFYVPDLPDKQITDFVDQEAGREWASRFPDQMRYTGFRQAILSTARSFIQSDPDGDFRAVGAADLPSLLVWGDADKTFPVEQAERVLDALGSNARFELVPDSGHALHYEKPDQVNAVIADFLASVGDSRPTIPENAPGPRKRKPAASTAHR